MVGGLESRWKKPHQLFSNTPLNRHLFIHSFRRTNGRTKRWWHTHTAIEAVEEGQVWKEQAKRRRKKDEWSIRRAFTLAKKNPGVNENLITVWDLRRRFHRTAIHLKRVSGTRKHPYRYFVFVTCTHTQANVGEKTKHWRRKGSCGLQIAKNRSKNTK